MRTGRPKTRVEVVCQHCEETFEVQPYKLSLGLGRFHSRACYHAHRSGKPRGPYRAMEPEERLCEACGKPFLVGGRGRPPLKQRLCSDECQRASRYRRGAVAKTLSVPDAAWMAGFIDGEGSIMLNPRRDAVALRLTASNTHRPTLERFVELTGIGAVIWNAKARNERSKAGGWWLVNGQGAASVLAQILPFLITKRRHAEIALSFEERLRDPALKADRTWQYRAMAEVRVLNRRGPAV